MFKNLVAWLLDMILAWAGFERVAKRDEQEKKATDEAVNRSDAAVADLGDGLRGIDTDPDNRDRQ